MEMSASYIVNATFNDKSQLSGIGIGTSFGGSLSWTGAILIPVSDGIKGVGKAFSSIMGFLKEILDDDKEENKNSGKNKSSNKSHNSNKSGSSNKSISSDKNEISYSDSSSSSDSSESETSEKQKIICVELFRQGLMAKQIYEADENFGNMLKEKYPLVLIGYQFWARPVVVQMRKSKALTNCVNYFAKPWSYEMAYIMGCRDKGDIIGKILMIVGFPICWLLGIIVTKPMYFLCLLLTIIVYLLCIRNKKSGMFKKIHLKG
jgi:hypothetical protein